MQLGGQGISIPGITVRHRCFEGFLAVSSVIDKGGIKIGAAGGDEAVCHLTDLVNVDGAVRQFRQAHQAESETERVFPEAF